MVRSFSRDDDDRYLLCQTIGRHLVQHITPMQAGQSEIEDDRGWCVRLEIGQRVNPIANGNDGEALGAECSPEQFAGSGVVLDHEHHFSLQRRDHAV